MTVFGQCRVALYWTAKGEHYRYAEAVSETLQPPLHAVIAAGCQAPPAARPGWRERLRRRWLAWCMKHAEARATRGGCQ